MMRLLLACIICAASIACSKSIPPDLSWVVPPQIQPGDAIPPPTGGVILVITGHQGVTNVGQELQLDMQTIERMGLVRYSVFDPYLRKDTVYTGVLLSTLADILNIDPAGAFYLSAIDDYHSTITIEQIQRWPILMATRQNGKYMDLGHGGPLRIIFPYDNYPELDHFLLHDLWIWNINTIEIE